MSLINQMLKDLEQRGAGSTDVEKIISSQLSATAMPYPAKYSSLKIRAPFLKISGLMILLSCGAYLWVQSIPAQSHSADFVKRLALDLKTKTDINTTNIIVAPKPMEPVANETLANNSVKTSLNQVGLSSVFESELKFIPIAAYNSATNDGKYKVLANYVPANENKPVRNLELNLPNALVKPLEGIEIPAHTAPEKAALAIKASAQTTVTQSTIDSAATGKQIRPEQKSGNLYHQALSNLQQGRVAEAQEALTQALEANPANQEARQTLAGLLLDNKRNDEARTILATGLTIAPEQSNFRMVLARLQVEAGDRSGALSTLEQGQMYAKNNADYQSFFATMLQRADRHEEAISHYNTSLSLNSGSASSLIGLGISLQALGKLTHAQDAYMRAQSLASISPELSQFVDQQLKQINQHLQNSVSK
jgi:MSHA biogenesis protein MshN